MSRLEDEREPQEKEHLEPQEQEKDSINVFGKNTAEERAEGHTPVRTVVKGAVKASVSGARKLRGWCSENSEPIQAAVRGVMKTLFVLFVAVCVIEFALAHSAYKSKCEKAEKVLHLMFDFGTFEQQEEQLIKIRQHTTKPVFNQLTQDVNEEKLTTYVGMIGNKCKVKIEKSTDSYVIYSLVTAGIESNRKFIFCFDVNESGKICKVVESELISLYDAE